MRLNSFLSAGSLERVNLLRANLRSPIKLLRSSCHQALDFLEMMDLGIALLAAVRMESVIRLLREEMEMVGSEVWGGND